MEKLLAEHFLIRKFPGPFVLQTPEPNYPAYALVLLVLFKKVSHLNHYFETRK